MTNGNIAFSALAAFSLLASAGSASAQSFAQLHKAGSKGSISLTETGGLVNFDGTVLGGGGYTVVHNRKGVYTITYPSGTWSAFPSTTCSPAGVHTALAICDVYNSKNDAKVTTIIHLYKVADRTLIDNAFSFTVVLDH
jgi:hypothetical protein